MQFYYVVVYEFLESEQSNFVGHSCFFYYSAEVVEEASSYLLELEAPLEITNEDIGRLIEAFCIILEYLV